MKIARMRLAALAGFLAVGLALPAWIQARSAWAQSDAKVESSATINAVSYQPIPPGALIETQPETQSQMDDDAWRQIDADLAGRGYQIGGDGNLVLTIATQLVSRLNADQSVSDVNAKKRDPKNAALFSTEGSTLLNPTDPLNRTDRTFRVSVSVYDRGSGHFVWRGSAERADASIDPANALREMLPALMDSYGESAENVTIPLQQ